MKSTIAASVLFASLAMAVPMNKRDIVTEEVVETVWTTTTVWVDPTAAPYGGFFESFPTGAFKHGAPSASPVAASPSIAVPTSIPAPAPPAVQSPAVESPAPPVPSPPAHKAAPPVEPVAPAAPSAPAANIVSGSTGSGSGTFTGDITFYEIENGQKGSCGLPLATDQSAVVALSSSMMGNGGNSNANTKCGQTINITYQGKTTPATVYDTCEGCKHGDIDLSPGLFKTVAPSGDGRVSGVSWSFA